MKKLALLLTCLLVTGCISKAEAGSASTANPSVVYLVHGQAQLTAEDLKMHPQVLVVRSFDELKLHAARKTALWIDKSATPLDPEQAKWMNEAPQAYYPIVLVGSSDVIHSFRDLLGLCCFMGPAGAYPGFDAPGFSVIQRTETNEPDAPGTGFIQGFDQKPTVQAVLDITNGLLTGTSRATPTAAVQAIATATVP